MTVVNRSQYRRPGRLDVAASVLARIAPRPLRATIDQARRDARALLDGARGTRVAPAKTSSSAPTAAPPLSAVDPLDHLLPRSVAKRVHMTRRDLAMVLGGLFGNPPSPLVERPPRATPTPTREGAPVIALRPRRVAPRSVRVTRVVRETEDAVSLYLAELDGGGLTHLPGQFLTIEVTVDGERLRRAYSLASAALPGHEPHITVKRIDGGRVSGHLTEHVRGGDTLAVLGPSGTFSVEPDLMGTGPLVLIAGGSGITPIISIAHTVLAVQPRSHVTLIYGNRRRRDIIFEERLATLRAQHPGRFAVDHVLSEAPGDWRAATGLLDRDNVLSRLESLGVDEQQSPTYFVCGPSPMMEAVREALRTRDVPSARLNEERFTSPEARETTRSPAREQRVTVHHSRSGERKGTAAAGQTLLEAGLAMGLDMPFSCAMGGCGACRVKVTAGAVQSDEPNCLTADEKAEGYALACCSRPTEAVTIEVEA